MCTCTCSGLFFKFALKKTICFLFCLKQGEHRELIELAPLCVTYFLVFLYLAFSVGKLKSSHHFVSLFDVGVMLMPARYPSPEALS